MRLKILESGHRPVQKLLIRIFKVISGGLVPTHPGVVVPAGVLRQVPRCMLSGRAARGDRMVSGGSSGSLCGLCVEAQRLSILNERSYRGRGCRHGQRGNGSGSSGRLARCPGQ